MPEARERRNWPQVGPRRCSGPIPALRRIVAIEAADKAHTEPEELALDPPVPHPGVIPGQAKRELPGLGIDHRSRRPSVPHGPLAGDELAVPAKERLGPDQERPSRLPQEHPARRREERLVGCDVARPLHLPPKDGELVAEHPDLQLGLSRRAFARAEQAEDAAQEHIEERSEHGATLCQIRPCEAHVWRA